MTTAAICLGTRASKLAVIQSTIVGNTLRARGERVEIVEITTSGDVRAPDTTWGEGAFVDALEVALRAGSIDAAVHSAKDMPIPGAADADLVVAAYPERADPRDVLVTSHGRGAWRSSRLARSSGRTRRGAPASSWPRTRISA